MIILFSLAFALQQQPAPPPPPANARDTTMRVIYDVGLAVADVRAYIDRFRTVVFNDSNAVGTITQVATALKNACAEAARQAATGRRVMCTHCLQSSLQPAFNEYRAYLPSLEGLGQRCAARLQQADPAHQKPAQLRDLALSLSQTVVTGLGVYERRLGRVLGALRAPARRTPAAPQTRPSQ